eukprot:gene11921-biopygen7248
MRSKKPKVLHEVGNRPMVLHVIATAQANACDRIAVVIGPGRDDVAQIVENFDERIEIFVQTERLGTAHAALSARAILEDAFDEVFISFADTPLVSPDTLQKMSGSLQQGADIVVLGFEARDPTGYGRLLVDSGSLTAIREQKDASEAEKAVRLCNAGWMAFRGSIALDILTRIDNKNAQNEFYLTDAVELANRSGLRAAYVLAGEAEVMGVNDRAQLAAAERVFQDKMRQHWLCAGVTMIAPETVYFSHDTQLAPDVTLEPNVFFGKNVKIAEGVVIHANSHIEGATIETGAHIGPYARLRPGSDVGANAKIGNFVETKSVKIAQGAKISHLSYIGDAYVGAEANIGAGTITCNYDGFLKSKTHIGANAFIGSNSSLVAPVTIGDGAYVGSGSVITDSVSADALAIARGRQVEKPGWAKRLEYRGYDSAGIATVTNGIIERRRAQGKLKNLELRLREEPLAGMSGIGHTRWATHGKPTENNAHPHASEHLAVVHNGIIENFRELREELMAKGYKFSTETDTEVVAHLVDHEIEQGKSPADAVAAALPRLKGAFALAFLFHGHDDLLIGARQGAPLAVGYGEGEMYLGSDALALAPFTDQVTYLEDGDWVVLTRNSVEFRDSANRLVNRVKQRSQAGAFLIDKGNYRHFMAKEIHEQPEVVGRTLAHYLDMSSGAVRLPFEMPFDVSTLTRITICACGTAYYAGLAAKYWFERYARIPVEIDVASEFRYREAPMDKGGLMIVISQSGETADTLAGLRYAKANDQYVLSVVNVPTSTIARESDIVAPTLAGPEIGVASTKAYTCQLSVLACLAVAFGHLRGKLDRVQEQVLVSQLIAVPGLMAEAIKREQSLQTISHILAKSTDVLYLGRGTSYPLAMEGALKLKELSYLHAEGYAAGELKHGPIALVDEEMPVIVIAPYDSVFEKTVSNMQEVAARGGKIIFIGDDRGVKEAGLKMETSFIMADMPPDFAPIVYAVPIQMLAYYTAVFMGKDVDQPRNLAKSVTVE